MYAISFTTHYRTDTKETLKFYGTVENVLGSFMFHPQLAGMFYLCDGGRADDLANLMGAMIALKELPEFVERVKDIRAFRVEQWSDFTPIFKR